MWTSFVRAIGMICIFMALIGTALSVADPDFAVVSVTLGFWIFGILSLMERHDHDQH